MYNTYNVAIKCWYIYHSINVVLRLHRLSRIRVVDSRIVLFVLPILWHEPDCFLFRYFPLFLILIDCTNIYGNFCTDTSTNYRFHTDSVMILVFSLYIFHCVCVTVIFNKLFVCNYDLCTSKHCIAIGEATCGVWFRIHMVLNMCHSNLGIQSIVVICVLILILSIQCIRLKIRSSELSSRWPNNISAFFQLRNDCFLHVLCYLTVWTSFVFNPNWFSRTIALIYLLSSFLQYAHHDRFPCN